MSDLLVRGLSPETVATLKKRAEAHGKSLNTTVKELLVDAVAADQAAADWARIREIRLAGRGRWKGPSVLEMLREDRDRR